MVSQVAFTLLIVAVGIERLAELLISKRNAAWSMQQGGVEYGLGHFPWMVLIHTGLLVGAVAEVWLADRTFQPALGITMLVIAAACQALRWWVITTLGRRWNTRVIVVPGLDRISGGPFRYMRHPNYVAVVLEGAALPLIHGAWVTALVFSVLNAYVLTVRIRCEDAALDGAAAAAGTTHGEGQ